MSDRVAVFNNGRIEQVDAPQDLYLHPKTAFVAGFVGTANVFEAEAARRLCGMPGSWSLRPEHVRLQGGGEVQVQGVVQAVQYQGAATRIELRLAEGGQAAGQPGEYRWRGGSQRPANGANGAGVMVAVGDDPAGKRRLR